MTKNLVATALAAVLCLATVHAGDAEDKSAEMKAEKTVTKHVHTEKHEAHKHVAKKADADVEETKEAKKEMMAKEEAEEEKAVKAAEMKKAAHHPKKHHHHEHHWKPRDHHGCKGDMNGTIALERCYLPNMIKENMADGVVGQAPPKMACEGKTVGGHACNTAKMDCHTQITNEVDAYGAWIWMPKGSCNKIEGASVVDPADAGPAA